jgi:hypothetical protein
VCNTLDAGEVELFFLALRSMQVQKLHFLKKVVLLRQCLSYVYALLSRNYCKQLSCILQIMLFIPRSAFFIRRLMFLSRFTTLSGTFYVAAAQMVPVQKLTHKEKLRLCMELMRQKRGIEAASVAKEILKSRPDDAEARHMLWAALLLQSEIEK